MIWWKVDAECHSSKSGLKYSAQLSSCRHLESDRFGALR